MSIITLNTLIDIQKVDKRGNVKIIKRNVECKKTFDTNNILVEQYVSSKGIVSKKWCTVKEGESYYKIAHSYEYVEKLINPPQLFIKGYKRY